MKPNNTATKKHPMREGAQHDCEKGLRHRHHHEESERAGADRQDKRSRCGAAGKRACSARVRCRRCRFSHGHPSLQPDLTECHGFLRAIGKLDGGLVRPGPGFSTMVPSRPATCTARLFHEAAPDRGADGGPVGMALGEGWDSARVRVTIRRVIGESPFSQVVTPAGSSSYRRANRYAERMSGNSPTPEGLADRGRRLDQKRYLRNV